MKNKITVLVLALSFLWPSHRAVAQTNATAAANSGPSGDDIRQLVAEAAALVDAAKTNLPDLLNEGLKRLTVTNSPLAWLRALNVRFKAFEPSAPGKNAGLGLDYAYDKAVTDAQIFGNDNPAFLSFSVKAKGTIAFDPNNNPADFLESGFQLHLWQYFGQTQQEKPGADGLTRSARTHRLLAKPPFDAMTGDQIRASKEWREYHQKAIELEPSDFFYDLAGNVALESNQTFSKRQWAYGLEFHPRFRAWNPDSAWSKFNFFDWPFALTRMIPGQETHFKPRGWFLPSLMGGIDLVDPVGNADRFGVDPDKSAYARVKAEIGFRSKVMEFEDGSTVWFNSGYRYFQELSASPAIKRAGLDQYNYFAASLELPHNVSITFSAGKLPFDLRNQRVWGLGYKFNF